MIKKIFCLLIAVLLVAGCKNQSYKEGTSVTMGLYVPTAEGLVGLQFLEYLNGCVVSVNTNYPFKVQRIASSTNTYFGIVTTSESSNTKIELMSK